MVITVYNMRTMILLNDLKQGFASYLVIILDQGRRTKIDQGGGKNYFLLKFPPPSDFPPPGHDFYHLLGIPFHFFLFILPSLQGGNFTL